MTGYLAAGGPYALAHRGGAGLAAENSMAAFGRSYALGVRYLETDVRTTSDGVCVAFHDNRLDRLTGVRGRVRDRSWPELRRLRADGEPVPRLEEMLETFPDARFTIDVKDPRSVASLARVTRQQRAQDRVCFAGARDRWLALMRELVGGAASTAVGWDVMSRLALLARAGRPAPGGLRGDAKFIHVPVQFARVPVHSRAMLRMCHGLGLKVLVWTVNDPALMHRLLEEGADGIFTDRPDLLREVMLARGVWLPPVSAPGLGSLP